MQLVVFDFLRKLRSNEADRVIWLFALPNIVGLTCWRLLFLLRLIELFNSTRKGAFLKVALWTRLVSSKCFSSQIIEQIWLTLRSSHLYWLLVLLIGVLVAEEIVCFWKGLKCFDMKLVFQKFEPILVVVTIILFKLEIVFLLLGHFDLFLTIGSAYKLLHRYVVKFDLYRLFLFDSLTLFLVHYNSWFLQFSLCFCFILGRFCGQNDSIGLLVKYLFNLARLFTI